MQVLLIKEDMDVRVCFAFQGILLPSRLSLLTRSEMALWWNFTSTSKVKKTLTIYFVLNESLGIFSPV